MNATVYSFFLFPLQAYLYMTEAWIVKLHRLSASVAIGSDNLTTAGPRAEVMCWRTLNFMFRSSIF